MLAGVCAQMISESRARTFLLTVRVCTESRAHIFLLKVQAFTESLPQTDPRKTVVRSRMNAYDRYSRYNPIWGIGKDVVWKVQKGISYDDVLQQGS